MEIWADRAGVDYRLGTCIPKLPLANFRKMILLLLSSIHSVAFLSFLA